MEGISFILVRYFSHMHVRSCKEMNSKIKSMYYNLTITRTLMIAIGLWPYQQSKLIRFQFICLSSILTASVIFQCTVFISQKCTPELIIKVLSSVCFCLFSLTKYNLFSLNLDIMKDMLQELFDECNKLKDANEIAIIDEYGCNGKRCAIIITSFSALSVFGFIIMTFCPNIFNFILRTNLSYSSDVLIVEYFINQEKYFYIIILHSLAAVFIAMTIILAIGLLFYSYFQFICGVFQIASYRIERAMSVHVLQNINLRKHIFICKSLICAVDSHRQAMKLCLLWESNCTIMVFFLIIFGVLTMSFNLFRMMSCGNDIKEFLISFINTFYILLYAFLSNYCAQLVTDLNHQLFVTAYKIPWYLAPLSIQKLILFLLQKTSKTFYVTCGGVYAGSIEGFAMIIKTSVSYFTVMHSVQ